MHPGRLPPGEGTLIVTRVLSTLVVVLLTSSAHAQVERHAIIVGSNQGVSGEPQLRYAESDARKFRELLVELGGFKAAHTTVLTGGAATDLNKKLIEVNDRIRSSPDLGRQAVLLVYYSGHASTKALHVGGSQLPLRQLEQLVRGSAAALRLLIVDACHSGEITRLKGAFVTPHTPIQIEANLPGEGVVFLTSSAAHEDAQESDRLRGSFFTHYLLSGLRGAADSNGDSRVTLSEVYKYAYAATVRASSQTLAGVQHPAFRYDLRGQGGWALTQLKSTTAFGSTLVFPPGMSYLLTRGHADGEVMAEVGENASARSITVPAGPYFVRGRGDRYLREGLVVLDNGQTMRLKPDDLARIEYARLARKGGVIEAVHGPVAAYQLRSSLWTRGGPCQGPALGYGLELRDVSLSAALHGCKAAMGNQGVEISAAEYGVVVRAARTWDVGALAFDVGLRGGASVLRQTFTTTVPVAARNTVAGSFGLTAGITYPLARGLYTFFKAGPQLYFFSAQRSREQPNSTPVPTSNLSASLVIQTAGGMGLWW